MLRNKLESKIGQVSDLEFEFAVESANSEAQMKGIRNKDNYMNVLSTCIDFARKHPQYLKESQKC